MTDIVKKLRWRVENTSNPTATTPMLCAEAADTIDALRAEVERLKEWNREIALNAREFVAENKKLRAALWGIHAVCNNWDCFVWMLPIRRIKRIASAALGDEREQSERLSRSDE